MGRRKEWASPSITAHSELISPPISLSLSCVWMERRPWAVCGCEYAALASGGYARIPGELVDLRHLIDEGVCPRHVQR